MSATCIVAKVGRTYPVPCLFIVPEYRTKWIPEDGWVPVIGPKHRDPEHLEFRVDHYHVDWRFVPAKSYRVARNVSALKAPHPLVITADREFQRVVGEPEVRRIRCRREMPDFPALVNDGSQQADWHRLTVRRFARLEIAQAFTCNKLKPGNVCPHRGIDLTPFEQPDGTAICPGHGLRWNLRTGELMPRHGIAQGRSA